MTALLIGIPIVIAIIFLLWSISFLEGLILWGIDDWWESVVAIGILLVYAYAIGWLWLWFATL